MKSIIAMVTIVLCGFTSAAFADGLQTSGGVKPKRDSLQIDELKAQIPTQVYVKIKSIQTANSLNSVEYYTASVNAHKSTVKEVNSLENELSPDLVEALKQSIQSDDWVPFKAE